MSRASVVAGTASLLHYTGLVRLLSLAAAYARRTPTFQVLTYHRVNDEADPFFGSVPTEVFARQMAFIARTYRVLPVEELAERMQRGSIPRRALAITFDDGYRDNLTHAAPVLARYRLPATIFLATGFIGTGEVPWWDRLAIAFKATQAEVVAAPGAGVLPLATQSDRLTALDVTLAHLKQLPDDDRQGTLDRLLGVLAETGESGVKSPMLTWDEVRALVGLGFSVGAHTVSHPILSRVTAERAWAEIVGSKTMIQSGSGTSPRAFAYPNGRPADYSETVKHLVQEAGFTCAVTTRFGVNTPGTSPWELRRGGPWEAHLPSYALKLAAYRLTGEEEAKTSATI